MRRLLWVALAFLLAGELQAAPQRNPQSILPRAGAQSGSSVRLEADQQRKEGDLFYADGNVDITYGNYRLRGDHGQYDSKSYVATMRGHVQFDVDTQHLTADSAEFNVRTGVGQFENVRGEVHVVHPANQNILVTPNPLVFQATEVHRLDARTYLIDHAWLTVCEPDKPTWQFFTSRATLHVDQTVAMVNANFRLFRIPLLYLPYASLPAGNRLRHSGFLLPDVADTSTKGVVLGDAYYWAPWNWADLQAGGAWLSERGWQQNLDLRAMPWDNVDFTGQYFGVIDRGLIENGILTKQGGHSDHIGLDARLGHGWRAVVNLNQLSSLTFQLAFAPTFGEAVNSEVRSSAFVSNHFHGFSFDLAGNAYKNYLSAEPEISVDLRASPEVRFSSVDQSPWRWLPLYFGVDSFASAAHRADANIDTPAFVQRDEIAPRAVLPLHAGSWLGLTATYTLRTIRYGSQMVGDAVVQEPFQTTTGEVSIDLRPPTLERIWQTPRAKWKHTIEPRIVYNYVRGLNAFDHIIRFDEEDTITDTNEIQYGFTQRLFHREGDGQAEELASWSLTQKYYFDPTFNGALVPGTRNVFEALDSISPFAFADEPRRFSPIESDLVVSPGGMYDGEVRLEYDTVRQRLTTAGTLVKIQPRTNFDFSLAHFSIDNDQILQPIANQIRAQATYGALNRRGWNVSMGFSYDITQQFLQSQLAQVSYNGGCCGIAMEYRRLALGTIRTENEFRMALIIANLGTFGNLRREDKIF